MKGCTPWCGRRRPGGWPRCTVPTRARKWLGVGASGDMLVDTSIWIDHLRGAEAGLVAVLEADEAETHPFVIGELACGRLLHRREILEWLQALPVLAAVEHHEALSFVEKHQLFRRGLGWVDVHLLASALLSASQLWTRDKTMRSAARHVGVQLFL
jgi:predicted nucleic acid-binding protein